MINASGSLVLRHNLNGPEIVIIRSALQGSKPREGQPTARPYARHLPATVSPADLRGGANAEHRHGFG